MSVYSLMTDNTAQPVTQALLDSVDMVTDDNGEFLITIDANPAQGRTNHLQTKPGTDWLNIRDVLGDWLTQTPNALRVRRLDRPDRAPLSDEELTERGVRRLLDGVFFAYYCSQSGSTDAAERNEGTRFFCAHRGPLESVGHQGEPLRSTMTRPWSSRRSPRAPSSAMPCSTMSSR